MHPPAIMSEFNLILLVWLVAIAGAIGGWILHACHQADRTLAREDRLPHIAVLLGAALGLSLLTSSDIPARLTPADRMLAERNTPDLARTLRQVIDDECPPGSPGDTAQLIFTVETESDLQPRITGCSRIGERQYLVKDAR